jgi:hypothetical protein
MKSQLERRLCPASRRGDHQSWRDGPTSSSQLDIRPTIDTEVILMTEPLDCRIDEWQLSRCAKLGPPAYGLTPAFETTAMTLMRCDESR